MQSIFLQVKVLHKSAKKNLESWLIFLEVYMERNILLLYSRTRFTDETL